jgi:hypothetical protein
VAFFTLKIFSKKGFASAQQVFYIVNRMKLKKLTPLFTVAALALALVGTGCNTASSYPQAADKNRNFLGIVKIEPNSFAHTPPTTMDVHTNDLIEKPDMSGTRVVLLWGLISYEDY